MHAQEKCNAHKERIGCVHCVFRFFDCVASRVSVVLHTAAWKPHVGQSVGLCDIQLFTFLCWISGSAVRHNIVMSNYVMSNYVTVSRQRPVCQFSWCRQHDTSPLWPVIKLQGDCTSDSQMVTSDDSGRSLAWPVITLLLRTSAFGFGHFLKFQKNRHIAATKLQFRFGSALKPAVFGFGLKTVTALNWYLLFLAIYVIVLYYILVAAVRI